MSHESTLPLQAAPAASSPAPVRRIPLWVKLAYTAFLCVLVPVYLQSYGPLNFLWFCDVALAMTLVAVWTEKPLWASMPAVGIVFPQLIWAADYVIALVTGMHPFGMSNYMFDPSISYFARGLSLFHGWLPFFLIWLVARLGYDRRALAGQTLVCWAVLVVSFLVVRELDPTRAGNVNKLFGPRDDAIQTFMPRAAWLGVLMLVYPLAGYLPSHLVFRKVFPENRS
jgi:hypothetical protein